VIVPKYEFAVDETEGGEIEITGHCDGYHSGNVSGADASVCGRVNPRRIGFVREDELDIPIYWEEPIDGCTDQ